MSREGTCANVSLLAGGSAAAAAAITAADHIEADDKLSLSSMVSDGLAVMC